MLTSEQQKIYNVKVPKGGYGYFTLYHGIYDPENDIDERPSYAQTGDLFEPEGSSVVYKATRKNGKTTWAIAEDAQRQSESGESGSGGGSLPADFPAEGIANANKFLGFDANGDYTAKDAPSGGAEQFIVTLTLENDGEHDNWIANKTCAQIYAAHQAVKECVAQLTYEYEGLDIPIEAPLTMAIGVEEGGETTYACTFSIPFVFEPDTFAMLNISGFGSNKGEWDVSLATAANPIPEYDSPQNGKVLGVSSGDLAWVDNYAPLIVTLTEDQSTGNFVGDKTFGEIDAAMGAGRNVVLSGTLGAPAKIVPVGIVLYGSTYKLTIIALDGQYTMLQGAENDYITVSGN